MDEYIKREEALRAVEAITTPGVFSESMKQKCIKSLENVPAENVFVLPCNVGDTVYYLDGKTIVKTIVHCISFGGRHGINPKGQIHIHDSDKYNITVNFEDFGKTVFFTRGMAEIALKYHDFPTNLKTLSDLPADVAELGEWMDGKIGDTE